MKLAAIDIGSNAARLLISEVIQGTEEPEVNKLNLFRVPLRLGFDVFEYQRISEEKIQMMEETLLAFRHLLSAYQIEHCIACATSAMRDASNASEIIKRMKQKTGINIEVISGDMEANLIYENHVAEHLDKEHDYLYIDVGGGSTELSFFQNGQLRQKKSFNIGTIRLLKDVVKDSEWTEMKDFCKLVERSSKEIIAIGSGGNINKIFSLSKKKEGKPLGIEMLRDYHREFSSVSLTERINKYKLREDRADVIVPALQIYVQVMKWAGADDIFVPKIGLADGLIRHLWDELLAKS